ncbi:hypothetical protein SAMN05446935_8294 [Burkholderia sp. YR290]|nr:hypothetical protein SAMN05446935_8294 [Burkholderia sp. YR290]
MATIVRPQMPAHSMPAALQPQTHNFICDRYAPIDR